MPPKRKAPAASSSRANKRTASGRPTPNVSDSESDDEYNDTPVMSETEEEDIQHLIQKYDPISRVKVKQTRDPASHLFKRCDEWDAQLKPDHAQRPCWVDPKGNIILESFSPAFRSAQAFLINIAEPQSRVSRMHEYSLTAHSLFAAVSVGLTQEDIIKELDTISKTPLPPSVVDFIVESTSSFGKARLVLKNTRYFIESADPGVLQKLLQDPIIGPCRVDTTEGFLTEAAPSKGNTIVPGTKQAAEANQAAQASTAAKDTTADGNEDEDVEEGERFMAQLRQEDDDEEEVDQVHSFQIEGENVQKINKRCREIGLPLTEEYDFHADNKNTDLEIDLKPAAQIRSYQEQALNKMFGNGRARSGIIVLPCGAGKTLVGITAACTVKKSIMVLCTSAMSVNQWRNEFIKWTNINPNDIATFTADNKEFFPGNAGVLITTYSMVTNAGKRSEGSIKVMEKIQSRDWGLLIADEVHVVPAEMFKKVTYSIASHCKLGLTATLLREDDKIDDLNFLIGPKLYEANWQELSEQGHIAKVQCAEVWCPMTAEFYSEYLKADTVNKRALLFTMNPTKFQYCQFLIDYHEKRGDKIIVFSDNVYALKEYAIKLHKAFIYGETPQQERQKILENFQLNEGVNTIFLSKIGDTSLDLPEATCLIQISSHYGSRRQEAQRLGRILRAKRRNDEGFNAFFYSLVSKDTMEMYYSSKRQAFLVDQGYAFKVITQLKGIDQLPGLHFREEQEKRDLLIQVMTVITRDEDALQTEQIKGDLFSNPRGRFAKKGAKRMTGTLAELGGAADMAYVEVNSRTRNQELKKKGAKNDFIRKLQRMEVNKRKARQSDL